MSARVFVLGAGRAGTGLARALRASGVPVVGVHGRHGAGGPDGVTVGALPESLAAASVVLVTVRDAQLDEALAELAAAPLGPGAVVLHASGSADPAGLTALRARGHACGTFHPLLPLAEPDRAAALLRGAWIGIDGDPAACDAAHGLAAVLGARTLEIPTGAKPAYHAAAVLASNFPVVLLWLGERVLRATGVDADAAAEALRPLFFAAVDNVRGVALPQALTGPVVRGDAGTVRANLAALRADPGARAAYRVLSRAALSLAAAAGTDASRLRDVERALADDDAG